jgi:hypothetical protein
MFSTRLGRLYDVTFLPAIERAADRLFIDNGHPEFAAAATVPESDLRAAVPFERLLVAELDSGAAELAIER